MQDRINELKCFVYDKMIEVEKHQIHVGKLQQEVQKASAEIEKLQTEMQAAAQKEEKKDLKAVKKTPNP